MFLPVRTITPFPSKTPVYLQNAHMTIATGTLSPSDKSRQQLKVISSIPASIQASPHPLFTIHASKPPIGINTPTCPCTRPSIHPFFHPFIHPSRYASIQLISGIVHESSFENIILHIIPYGSSPHPPRGVVNSEHKSSRHHAAVPGHAGATERAVNSSQCTLLESAMNRAWEHTELSLNTRSPPHVLPALRDTTKVLPMRGVSCQPLAVPYPARVKHIIVNLFQETRKNL